MSHKVLEFPCKEPGCGRKVRYQREEVPGSLRMRKKVPDTFAAYLTCDGGHVNRYDIQTSADDTDGR